MNGEEHSTQVPQHIKDICEAVPHFGDAWHKETYQNMQGNELTMLTPPPRLMLEKPKFFSKITLMTRNGPMDLGFEIPKATTLAEAEHLWKECAQSAIVEMHNQMQKNQRRVLLPQDMPQAPLPKKLILQ